MARFGLGRYVAPALSLRLEQAPGKRYLRRTSGQPFQVRGTSLWCLCQATQAKREELLESVASHGFNSVVCMSAVSPTGREQYGPPQADGLSPFTGTKLIPNEAYWSAVVDHLLTAAAVWGLVVQLAFLYFGHGSANDGFRDRVATCSEAECFAFGEWLGGRYGAVDNLIWIVGGDNQSLWDSKWQAIVDGILSVDSGHLIAGHAARNQNGSSFGAFINLETSYPTESTIVDQTLAAYAGTSDAVLNFENRYEGDGSKVGNPNMSAAATVAQQWQAFLANAAGANFGNHPQWTLGYICNWPSETSPYLEWANWETTDGFESAGTLMMAHLHAFFDSIDWPSLVGASDESDTFLTGDRKSGANYVAGAFTETLGVAYTQGGDTVRVDLANMGGPVTARWVNPANGNATAIGTGISNDHEHDFTPPTSAPWVLHLEAA